MKNSILATSVFLLLSVSALANNESQKTANEMIKVLQSQNLSTILMNMTGKVQIQGIRYLYSGRAKFGPSSYEISFHSYTETTIKSCTVLAHVDIQTVEVLEMGQILCN